MKKRPAALRRLLPLALLLLLTNLPAPAASPVDLGRELPLWSALPFAGILLSIALLPLLASRLWHHHFGKVTAGWALLFAVPFLLAYRTTGAIEIAHIYLLDYLPFIILLWALYTISGGILLTGSLRGTPAVNTLLLAIGTLLASWVGTTGAAMLLVRPLIRSNQDRRHKAHVIVFFIFLVANIGGSLTPLGDPPLFLGFLHGVSFFWTFRLLPATATLAAGLLALFFLIDTWHMKREGARPPSGERQPLRLHGLHNLLFLAGVVAGVLFSGTVHLGEIALPGGIHLAVQNLLRDAWLLLMGYLSLRTTRAAIRSENRFSWGPIQEVAILFAGIFMTIIPALAILRAGVSGSLGFLIRAVRTPAHYFWASGALSSFLDNAPTYLTFFNTEIGQFFPGMGEAAAVAGLMTAKAVYLKAISAGAVFMGANTYIGNAPNFMVKAIAEENGIAMPSFFGYIFRYSLPILIPAFALLTLLFF